ncbi:MAG: 50S ribosomal protein L9 [Verrucomicrobiia bacterium]|jgi:large subunit ribosomal protein L9
MGTQIILTATLEELGAQGELITVADGYARNFLIPQGMAIPATPGNKRRIEFLRKKHTEELTKQLDDAKALAAKLEKFTVTIKAKVGADNKLFGSVGVQEIADVLKAAGINMDRKKIVLEKPIHEAGVFDVEAKLHAEVTAKFKVAIEASPADAGPTHEPKTKPKRAAKKA